MHRRAIVLAFLPASLEVLAYAFSLGSEGGGHGLETGVTFHKVTMEMHKIRCMREILGQTQPQHSMRRIQYSGQTLFSTVFSNAL